jgi:hypothetical protein
MKNLKMKEGKIDEYIANFERLAHRAGVDTDNPSNMHTFARGLPMPLIETIIRNNNPQNFQQWAAATQKQQHNWMQIQSYKGNYSTPQPQN